MRCSTSSNKSRRCRRNRRSRGNRNASSNASRFQKLHRALKVPVRWNGPRSWSDTSIESQLHNEDDIDDSDSNYKFTDITSTQPTKDTKRSHDTHTATRDDANDISGGRQDDDPEIDGLNNGTNGTHTITHTNANTNANTNNGSRILQC